MFSSSAIAVVYDLGRSEEKTEEEGSSVSDSGLGFEQEYALRFLEVVVSWNEGGAEKSYTVQSLRVAPEVE